MRTRRGFSGPSELERGALRWRQLEGVGWKGEGCAVRGEGKGKERRAEVGVRNGGCGCKRVGLRTRRLLAFAVAGSAVLEPHLCAGRGKRQ